MILFCTLRTARIPTGERAARSAAAFWRCLSTSFAASATVGLACALRSCEARGAMLGVIVTDLTAENGRD